MGNPDLTLETSGLPRPLPPWLAVCAGLLVAGGLIACESLGKTPPSLIAMIGGFMGLAHGLVAYVLFQIIAEALTLAMTEDCLAARLHRAVSTQGPLPSHPGGLFALSDFQEHFGALFGHVVMTRRNAHVFAYVVPLVGLIAAMLGQRDGAMSWSQSAGPLLFAIGESLLLLLLGVGVSKSLGAVQGCYELVMKQEESRKKHGPWQSK